MDCNRGLRQALSDGDVEYAKEILQNDDVDLDQVDVTHELQTPLMRVCHLDMTSSDKCDLVRMMLRKHPDVNIQDGGGRTALAHACIAGSCEVIELLSSCEESDPNIADQEGNTPMIYACRYADADTLTTFVQSFQDRGLDIRKSNFQGQSAVTEAEKTGKLDLLKLLLCDVTSESGDVESAQVGHDTFNRGKMCTSSPRESHERNTMTPPIFRKLNQDPMGRVHSLPGTPSGTPLNTRRQMSGEGSSSPRRHYPRSGSPPQQLHGDVTHGMAPPFERESKHSFMAPTPPAEPKSPQKPRRVCVRPNIDPTQEKWDQHGRKRSHDPDDAMHDGKSTQLGELECDVNFADFGHERPSCPLPDEFERLTISDDEEEVDLNIGRQSRDQWRNDEDPASEYARLSRQHRRGSLSLPDLRGAALINAEQGCISGSNPQIVVTEDRETHLDQIFRLEYDNNGHLRLPKLNLVPNISLPSIYSVPGPSSAR